MSNQLSVREKVVNLVDPDSQLSLSNQAQNLGMARQSLYYKPVSVDPKELEIKKQIDEIYTKYPFYGYRKIKHELILSDSKLI